jgi:excinuclease ABC subunit C
MDSNREQHLSAVLKNLPGNPGVYRYYDKDGRILYVGKAKNLKKRVTSYFIKNDHPARTQLLVKRIANIEYSIVGTEKDALLLENSLIKELQPKFNVMLKDDKTFPYIRILRPLYVHPSCALPARYDQADVPDPKLFAGVDPGEYPQK